MSRFTVCVLPDGKALLATEDMLSPEDAEGVLRAFTAWKDHGSVLILADARVQFIEDIELDPTLRSGSDGPPAFPAGSLIQPTEPEQSAGSVTAAGEPPPPAAVQQG